MPTKADKTGEGVKRLRRAPKRSAAAEAPAAAQVEQVMSIAVGPPAEAPRRAWMGGGPSPQDITTFLRQLIMMLEAGTPLLRSLQTLSQRGENKRIRALAYDISQYVEMGNPLWQAFRRNEAYFDPVFWNLVKASEASGTLVTVLRRLVTYRERREMLRRRVQSTLWYPAILVVACGAVITLIAKLVIPQFQQMLLQFGQPMPKWSGYFIGTIEFLTSLKFVITAVVVIVVLVILYKILVRNPLYRVVADRVKLAIPRVGPDIVRKYALVELTRSLGLLLRSGLSMMSTLELTERVIHNRAVANILRDMRDSVERGAGIEQPLRAHPRIVPGVVADMLVTGEEAGQLDDIAEHISETYEQEVNISVNSLGELIQPVMTLFIGVIVLLMFLSVYVPVIGMIQQSIGT